MVMDFSAITVSAYGRISVLALSLPLAVINGANAVEGGNGAYLLGSRDSLAGIVPPPGTYFTNDTVFMSGSVSFLSIGGAVLSDVSTNVFIEKLNLTHVFETPVLGGHMGLTVTLPIAWGSLDFGGELNSGLTGSLSDQEFGTGDLTLTPSIGWSDGHFHGAAAISLFLPTGKYSDASVDLATRSVTALNFGKNRVAIDPTLSITYLNPDNGREFSAAAGITFSFENSATDYQTAPEFHLELTAMQHLPNKLALGLTGYTYQQLADDSGAGAASTKALTGASSLRAAVYGIGPIVTYSLPIGGTSLSLKAKYIHEFAAKRRLESDVFWGTIGVAF